MTPRLPSAVATALALLSAAEVACQTNRGDGPPAASRALPANDTVPLACHFSSAIDECPPTDSPVAALVSLANRLPLGMKDCLAPEVSTHSSWKAEALPTLDQFRASTVTEHLSGNDRLIAQNSALHIALCSDGEARKEYAALVKTLASDRFGEEPSADASREVRDLFGNRLVLRSADLVPMFHDRAFSFTRFFLPFDGDNVQIDVGYLVSVDSHWMPHLTDIVGSVEARTPIDGPLFDACVLSLEASAFRCNDPAVLHLTRLEARLPPGGNGFWLRGNRGGAGCLRCHDDGPNGTSPLEPNKASKELELRRKRFLDAATESLAHLCKDADLC